MLRRRRAFLGWLRKCLVMSNPIENCSVPSSSSALSSSSSALSSSSSALSSSPIVIIFGATGTGKSKLAVELAQIFDGEVINADAMQIYSGLEIATNKESHESRRGVPHHLFDFIDPVQQYTAVDFRRHALPLVRQIQERKKLAVIVGGTHYYIESILWDQLLSNSTTSTEYFHTKLDPDFPDLPIYEEPFVSTVNVRERRGMYKSDPVLLHDRLREIDPDSAARIHPNNQRKVIRALEVCDQTKGKTAGELYSQQTGDLLFPNACILWIQCNSDVLGERLDARVDDMVARGLVEELRQFRHRLQTLSAEMPDYTIALLQCIGLKEFGECLLDDYNDSDKLNEGIRSMKLSTRRYAHHQLKWIRQRFLRRYKNRATPPVYSLDGTDSTAWSRSVTDIAEKVVGDLLAGKSTSGEISPLPVQDYDADNQEREFYCETCDRKIYGAKVFRTHLKSRRHGERLRKLNIVEKRQEEMVAVASNVK